MSSHVFSADSQRQNKRLEMIGRDVFEYEISKFLQPYERFLLASTCKWMCAIFNISNDNVFTLHSESDLSILKHDIIDKYFRKRKTYRPTTNCIDFSKIYSKLSRHEKLCKICINISRKIT